MFVTALDVYRRKYGREPNTLLVSNEDYIKFGEEYEKHPDKFKDLEGIRVVVWHSLEPGMFLLESSANTFVWRT